MPLEAQAKLLRMLETREVTPLGSHQSERVDVRIVCATHRALPKMVREDRFRADLYARIGGHVIVLPPLRERKEDIYQLTRLFVERAGAPPLVIKPPFMLGLCAYDWPFNIRELEAAVRRAVTLADGVLDEPHLPPDALAALLGTAADTEKEVVVTGARSKAPSEDEIRALLVRHEGNVAAIARELGKDRAQIHRWLRRYGLAPEDYRP
jgi:transcriptional regulator of acetoin/glycerol metabolism